MLLVIDMRQIRCLFLCICLLCAASSAVAGGEPLRVGLADDYPPLSYTDGAGQRMGFEYDLAQDLCRHLDRPCIWTFATQEELLQGLRDGSLDMIFSQRRDPEGKDLLYSRAYCHSRPMCIGRAHGPGPDDAGTRIGVYRDSLLEKLARKFWPGATIVSGSVGGMIRQLREGGIDVLFINDLAGYAFLLADGGQPFEPLEVPMIVDRETFGQRVAVRRCCPELLKDVDSGLKSLLYSGELHNRSRKYFQYIIY